MFDVFLYVCGCGESEIAVWTEIREFKCGLDALSGGAADLGLGHTQRELTCDRANQLLCLTVE